MATLTLTKAPHYITPRGWFTDLPVSGDSLTKTVEPFTPSEGNLWHTPGTFTDAEFIRCEAVQGPDGSYNHPDSLICTRRDNHDGEHWFADDTRLDCGLCEAGEPSIHNHDN